MLIKNTFNKSHSLFIPFIMAGHPSEAHCIDAILALANVGADIIEIGVPFSDPVADGPVNQQAALQALDNGTTLQTVLNSVQQIRQLQCAVPILLFSYFNPILNMGVSNFIRLASDAGVNGVLIVDLPFDEGRDYFAKMQRAGLETAFLVAPTTSVSRLTALNECDPCFIYVISRLGVTGNDASDQTTISDMREKLSQYCPRHKKVIGFGINTPDLAMTLAPDFDGVVVGSRLVATLENQGLNAFSKLASEFACAIKA